MLSQCNLQFTNANLLNDPFDCHPGLVVNADESLKDCIVEWTEFPDGIGELGYFPSFYKDITYICSLSMVFDSILMWSYYTNAHKGVCIGIDMNNLNQCFPFIEFKVEYPDNLVKYDCTTGTSKLAFKHQLATKAPEWKHEKEVRLLLPPPHERILEYLRVNIRGNCFAAIYLGVNLSVEDSDEIIYLAQKLNPKIMIYRMSVNPHAFNLIPKSIN